MTVKELIVQLLDYDMNKRICLADDVVFEDKDEKYNGSVYGIKSIDEGCYNVYLNFDNRHHRLRGGEQNDN